jgi:putative ABC transport system permease protein
LFHDRGRLVASLAGVTCATVLVATQVGLYEGFLRSASAIVTRMGGDAWVMAKNTRVFDFAEPLSPSARSIAASHPCVRRVRGVISAFANLRTPSGVHEGVEVIGFEPTPDVVFPWTFSTGLPADLHGTHRVSVDAFDLARLEIPNHPIGAEIDLGDSPAWIAAVTGGIRGFTLSPYVFAELDVARLYAGMSDEEVHYLVLDLAHPSCVNDVRAAVERQGDLQVEETAVFARMTEDFWVGAAGAGTALALGAIMGLVVGIAIVGQTLYSLANDHRRELATLKAIGAEAGQVLAFVAWQAAVLAVVGGVVGLGLAALLARGAGAVGLDILLTTRTLVVTVAAVVGMCSLASLWGARAVLRVEAQEVFR